MDEAILANDKPSGHGGLENDWAGAASAARRSVCSNPMWTRWGTQQVLMTSVTVPLLDQGPCLAWWGRHLPGDPAEPGGRDGPDPLQGGRARCFCSAVKGGWPAWKGSPVALGNLLEQQGLAQDLKGG